MSRQRIGLASIILLMIAIGIWVVLPISGDWRRGLAQEGMQWRQMNGRLQLGCDD
jgi:hypothetical protein